MPWVWIGRHCFDLSDVILVSKSGEGGLTITLRTNTSVDLDGPEVADFLSAWQEHSAARQIERGPPRVLKPTHGRPGGLNGPSEVVSG